MLFTLGAFVLNYFPANFAAACSDKTNFFNLIPPWYEYLNVTGTAPDCNIAFKVPDDFLAVGLAIVDMLLRLGGLAAMIGIIAAGIGIITAGGDTGKAATARRRIYNALIGLVIVVLASGFVAFVGNYLN